MARPSTPTLSRYELIGRLATGGMAEVWLARATGLAGFEKVVVIKTILPHLAQNDRFVQMFVNEARLAAMLGHPNCVQIFDLGQEGSVIYIAMEFIDGFSLTRLLTRAKERGRPVPEDVLVRIVMDACSGLEYAHRLTDREGQPLGLVHRDVSPDNLIVSFAGLTKIVDFGVAKAMAASNLMLSTAGTVKGKHGFIAPEYLKGLPVDGRADVFALGVTLYRALTRKRPFPGNSDVEVSYSVLEATPKSPLEHVASISPALSGVVMMALEKDPDARFASARAFRQALEASVVRPADVEEVADYMNSLWPPGDPERVALHSLHGGKTEERSGPALAVVHSGDFEAVSSGTLQNPVVERRVATDVPGARSRVTPAHPAAFALPTAPEPAVPLHTVPAQVVFPQTGEEAALPVHARTAVVPPQAPAQAEAPPSPVFFEPTPSFDEAPSVWPKVVAVLILTALAAGGVLAWRQVKARRGAAALTAMGRLEVPAATPALKVMQGDVELGTTPLSVAVPAGAHTLRLVGPDGSAREVKVSVEPGKTATVK